MTKITTKNTASRGMDRLNRIVYAALKRHISVVRDEQLTDEDKSRLMFKNGHIVYFFDASPLNDGLSSYDEKFIDSVLHSMSTKNMWNVAQRFYSLLKNCPDIDNRLLNS